MDHPSTSFPLCLAVDNSLLDLHNSSHHTKAEFNSTAKYLYLMELFL